MKQAIEASSVIWENLAVEPKIVFRNRILVISFIAIFLIFIAGVFTYIKSFAGDFIEKFSSSVNCKAIDKFVNFDKLTFKKYAEYDKENTL